MAIKCPTCHADNPDTSRFCSNCATQLTPAGPLPDSLTKTIETPVHALAKGTLIAGKYRIVEEIGRGGMGVVYRAHDESLNRDVAIKVLPPEFASDPERLRRFEQEARAVAALNHPSIVAIYEVGTHEGAPCIVTELLEGESLRERLSGGALLARKAVEYAVQIAQGLAAAHEKGITHRDLKPENIFVTADGRIKILDFGLAKLPPAAGRAPKAVAASGSKETETGVLPEATAAGVVLGTVGYMSPEQVQGERADHRSDLFSFGAILYEMLAGRRAFQRNTSAETMTAILRDEPPEISAEQIAVSPAIERLMSHCLEKNPAERFQSARDLAFGLQALSGSTISVTAKPTLPAAISRKTALVAAGLVVLAVGLVVLAYLLGGRAAAYHAPVYRQITFRRGFLQNARFAPDGEMVLYSGEWQGSPNELFQGRFDSPFSRPVGLADATIAAVSSTGELAVIMGCQRHFMWFCNGTLARVALTGGSPRPIAENTAYADWSPDGKDLAAVRYGSGEYRLEYPIGKVLYRTRGWLASPRFSPRGERIAFIDHPSIGDDGSISVTDLQGNVKVLSAGWNGIWGLAWSPGGDEVWFAACKPGVSEPDTLHATTLSGRVRTIASYPGTVRLHDISAKGLVLLSKESWRGELYDFFPGNDRERDLSWLDWSVVTDISPDGTQLLFSGGATGGAMGVSYLRKADGSPAVLLGEGTGATFSPDLKWVALFTHATPASLNLLPTGAGESRTLERGSIERYLDVGWHPDGKQILFVGRQKGEGWRVFRQNIAGGPPVPALPVSFTTRGICLSPDGRFIVAERADGNLYRVPLEGGAPAPLPGLTVEDAPVLWSADGRSLYVVRVTKMGGNVEIPAKVYRVDISTGEKQLWKEIAPTDRTGVFNIMVVVIARDERSYAYSFGRALSELFVADGLK